MKYFRIFPDVKEGARRLGMPQQASGEPVDCSLFFRPDSLPYSQLRIPIDVEGYRTDFTIAPIEIPVLSLECSRVVQTAVRHPIEFVDATLSNGETVKILHVSAVCECLDYNRSHLSVYPKNYPRKELVDKPQYVTKLAIDHTKTGELDIFRVKDYEAALIISGRVQDVLQEHGYQGYTILYEV